MTGVIRLLENNLQGELHDPGWPRCIDLPIAQVVVVPSTGAAEGRSAVSVGASVAGEVDVLPLGMVERVEGLPAELKNAVFAPEPRQLEVLEQGHIPIVTAGT